MKSKSLSSRARSFPLLHTCLRATQLAALAFFLAAFVAPVSRAGDAPAWMHALTSVPLPDHDDKTDAVLLYSEDIVTVQGNEIKTTPREYDLLRLLVMHAGKVLTHKSIMKEVWGGETDVQYLRIYVRTLRQKLEADPEQPRLIMTERGVGYRLRQAD